MTNRIFGIVLVVSGTWCAAQTAEPTVPTDRIASPLSEPSKTQTTWPRDLKLSDFPTDKDNALDIGMAFKCAKIASIVNEKDEDLSWVPNDVLKELPAAANRCLALQLGQLKDDQVDLAIRNVAVMVDASAEIDRREYNDVVVKYNALLQTAKDLNSNLREANAKLGRQQRINDALAVYTFMPKYTPPPVRIFTPPAAIHCTSRTVGGTTYTDCQ